METPAAVAAPYLTIPGSLEYKRGLIAIWDDVEWLLCSRS